MALIDTVYRSAAPWSWPPASACHDGRCLLCFARAVLPCVYVLLLVIISVGGLLHCNAPEPHSPPIQQRAGCRPPWHGRPRRALLVAEGGAARPPILQRVDRRLRPPTLLAWKFIHTDRFHDSKLYAYLGYDASVQ